MLMKFSVKNFKGFKDELFFDFSEFRDYKFNKFAIKDNKAIKSAILYGKNGSGKSNFGFALFDIILHLTDKRKARLQTGNYLNGDSDELTASFSYEFLIDDISFKYSYRKREPLILTYEELIINSEKVFSYNFEEKRGDFPGLKIVKAERLKTGEPINISVLRYIAYNANISLDNPIQKLMDFINNMLWFRSTSEVNDYLGMKNDNDRGEIVKFIIESGKVKELETYLQDKGINFNLEVIKDVSGNEILTAKYKYKKLNFFDAASNGTKVLLLYYFWILKLEKASFVFIDEFDAFFHMFLARDLFLEIIKQIDSQIIITTHNTDLMSNNILRPDCYFIISNGKIKSLPNCTQRELREGHNLEKMFKSGEFNAV